LTSPCVRNKTLLSGESLNIVAPKAHPSPFWFYNASMSLQCSRFAHADKCGNHIVEIVLTSRLPVVTFRKVLFDGRRIEIIDEFVRPSHDQSAKMSESRGG
jgi:hypothetical protein